MISRRQTDMKVPEDVSAVADGDAVRIERAATLTLALTLLALALPWLTLIVMRDAPYESATMARDYAPLPRDVALLLVRFVPALVAVAALVGTVVAAARASTAGGRLVVCMGGVLAMIAVPGVVAVELDEWARPFSRWYEDDSGVLEGFVVMMGLFASPLLGCALSRLGVWALDAAWQPSIERLSRFGRKAGVLVACVLVAVAVCEHGLFSRWASMPDDAAHAAYRLLPALGALCAAAAFHARARRVTRWLEAVRAERVPGWRVRDLGSEDRLERLPSHEETEQAATPYRDVPRSDEPVALVSLSIGPGSAV